MKNRIFNISALAFVAITFVLTSCNKDNYYQLGVDINYKVGTETFAYDQVYTINGVAVKFTLVQFYASGINAADDDGNTVTFNGKYLLVKPSVTNYELGTFSKKNSIEHIHAFNFNLGVDSETNSQTEASFTSRAASDPLSAQNPAMHWSWSSGYIFLKMEGMVDTTGDGTVDAVAEWHIGSDAMLRPVSVTAHGDLEKGENTLGLNFDLAALFSGVDMITERTTHTMDNMPVATKIANNLAGSFSHAD